MALLELQKVTKYFGGLIAVNELNMSVKKGEIVGLIGPNGAGKTTAFNMISGTFSPTRGKIIFKDRDITGFSPHRIAGIGLVRTFQLTTLFKDMSVLQNIILGLHLSSNVNLWAAIFNPTSRKSDERLLSRAIEIADFVGLTERKQETAKNLSHGHQKALQLAVALATNPELLLLDEPFNGMSVEEQEDMINKINKIRDRGITILIVEHVMNIIMKICDRIYVLNFGKKIAEGSPKDICENKEVIEAYLGTEYAVKC